MTVGLDLAQIAREVSLDLPEGSFVNLGIGLPTLIASCLSADREVILHSENGILGVAPLHGEGGYDPDLIDAGKQAVSLRPGGSFVNHAESFGMIRGGHLDIAVMGAFQISAQGDLANWSNGEAIPGVGGAMDLAVGVPTIYVMMRHLTRDGAPKIVPELTLPVTGRSVVSRIYTELGIFELDGGALVATALAPGCDRSFVAERTGIPVVEAERCQDLPREERSREELPAEMERP